MNDPSNGARRWLVMLAAAWAMAACGGSDTALEVSGKPADRAQAARFLAQASFGPTPAEIDHVLDVGYGAWIDEQLAKPTTSHRAQWDAQDAIVRAQDAARSVGQDGVLNSFWTSAVRGEDQLRQRVAFALSQIFVISMQDAFVGDNARATAAYLDMLADKGFGNYRQLLEAVARHPMMGVYLSHLRNRKADARSGRVPDENFAREVMQLFSVGLHELEPDGSPRLAGGQPVAVYGPDDIAGLAKVFTGFSWDCPTWPDNACFGAGVVDGQGFPDRGIRAMRGYPQFHSGEEKRYLGDVIAPQAQPDPDSSLAAALDRLASHPNVGPFIGRQLIQRLVTSNPSPAYVAAVAAAFNDNGQGVRGDMKAVVRRVLLHPEARADTPATGGKLREPVLKVTAVLRAFTFASDSGWWRLGNTDNPGLALGQSAMRAPSVFNFWRPGYVPPGTQAAAAGLVAPEMQVAQETAAAGYVNFLRDGIAYGLGAVGTARVGGTALTRRDVQPDFSGELALAVQPDALVDHVAARLLPDGMPAALRSELVAAVGSIAVPAPNPAGSNRAQIDGALRNRVNAAILLTAVSPEFQVQK